MTMRALSCSHAKNGERRRRFPLDGYDGSKGGAGVYHRIISQIPPHETFIECFVGSGQITRHKLPARSTIVIDSDAAVIAAWKKSGSAALAICGDAVRWLERRKWQGNEVVYCDPPYLRSVRSWQGKLYSCEFWTIREHTRLLKTLLALPVPAMISGYASPLYSRLLKRWRPISYQTTTRAGRPVTEWLWMNYPEPFELHDYRFLGDGFRERERIKRRKVRWKARLLKMPALERMAVLSAIAEIK